jgi:hypothetical protein
MEKTLTFDDWIEKYNPIKNHLVDHGSFGGYIFETYDDEVDFVASQNPHNIWTMVWAEDCYAVVPGFRWVNREHYLISTVPFTEENLHEEYLCI